MRAVVFLALKDLRLLLRDRSAAFFAFAFPLAIAVFFGYVFGGTTAEPLHVAVFVERPSPASDALLRTLGEDAAFRTEPAATREDGERSVRAGTAAAMLVVPVGYAEGIDELFSGGGARIGLVVDPSRRAEGAMLVGKVHEIAFRTVFSSLSDPAQLGRVLDRAEARLEKSDLSLADRIGIRTALARARDMAAKRAKDREAGNAGAGTDAIAAWQPVAVDVAELAMRPGVPANSFAISFTQGIAWALFGAVSAFGAGFAEERDRGTLVRLLVSPLGRGRILLGKALGCFAACVATQSMLLAVGIAAFGVQVSSWPLLAAAIGATAFCFCGVMVLVAAGFRTQGGAQGAGRAVLLMLAMIGGGSVPLVFMPPALRVVSNASPFKWAVVAAEGATWRAWGIDDMWLPVAVLLAIGVAGLFAGAALVRRTF
jgi:ABC-2 type transport system permease protein